MRAKRKSMRVPGKLVRNDRGATAVEYGLICALIVIASLGGMSFFGQRTIRMYNGIASNVSSVM